MAEVKQWKNECENREVVEVSEIFSVAHALFGCDPCNQGKIPEPKRNLCPIRLLINGHSAMFIALHCVFFLKPWGEVRSLIYIEIGLF